MPLWIVFSLSAMLCEVAKVLIIRKLCTGIHSRLVVLASRIISAIILLPMLFICGVGFPLDGMFWLVILTTALITFAGSIWVTEAIQFGNLTIVMPMQAAVPVFSLLTLWLGWHETPKNESVLYMLLSMAAVGWTLYAANRDKSSAANPFIRFCRWLQQSFSASQRSWTVWQLTVSPRAPWHIRPAGIYSAPS